MISVETALNHINTAAQILKMRRRIHSMSLEDAIGHELARDVKSALTHPPQDMSAMDGYAVKLSDIKTKNSQLNIIGEARAGDPFPSAIDNGQAVRIFTGGVIPPGADTVVIQENTERTHDFVTILSAEDQSKHIRRAGIDFHKGDNLIKAGTRLTARHIAVAAAGNQDHIDVFEPIKLALLSNGDELKPVGSDLNPGQIINSNGPALRALLETWGAKVIDLGISPDNKEEFTSHITRAESPEIDADIIVPIGGASVGDHDLAKPAFASKGYENIFSKVAVRPGKPVWMAEKNNRFVLGLPGNPASALVCAHIFLRPLLGAVNAMVKARLERPLGANGTRETYMRGHAYLNETGQLIAHAFPRQDSGLVSPYSRANILLRLPPHSGPWDADEMIDIMMIAPLISAS